MKNFQFVTAIHGNEYLPTLALASRGESQIIANPKALSRGLRFIENDLNASFGKNGNTYEEKRARELDLLFDPQKLVVDFHTFSIESEPFVIIVDLAMIPLASSLGIKSIVYMKHNIKSGHSVIDHHAGVSIEVGKHTDSKAFEMTLNVVNKLKNDELKPEKARVYQVYDRITEKGEYQNFVPKNGVIPILYGERAYESLGFYGLAAKEITGTI